MVGAVLRVGINISIFLSIVHIEATVNETAAVKSLVILVSDP